MGEGISGKSGLLSVQAFFHDVPGYLRRPPMKTACTLKSKRGPSMVAKPLEVRQVNLLAPPALNPKPTHARKSAEDPGISRKFHVSLSLLLKEGSLRDCRRLGARSKFLKRVIADYTT